MMMILMMMMMLLILMMVMMTLMDIGVVSHDERVLCSVHPTQLCYGRG
jgi:hypothetical protein